MLSTFQRPVPCPGIHRGLPRARGARWGIGDRGDSHRQRGVGDGGAFATSRECAAGESIYITS